jgi:hypothetical protein
MRALAVGLAALLVPSVGAAALRLRRDGTFTWRRELLDDRVVLRQTPLPPRRPLVVARARQAP